jgi:iron complex transport system substrate-binding protein
VRPVRVLGAAIVTAAVTLAAGCGGDGDTKASGDDAKTVTVQAGNGAVTVPAPPQRNVSLSPTHTETQFANGAR